MNELIVPWVLGVHLDPSCQPPCCPRLPFPSSPHLVFPSTVCLPATLLSLSFKALVKAEEG